MVGSLRENSGGDVMKIIDLVSMICVKIEQCVCIAFIYCAPQSAELMPSRCRLDRIGYTSGEGTYHHTVLLQ